MKTKNVFRLLLLFLVTVLAVKCSDDETEPLRFYNDSYEVQIHGTRYIGVESGSGNYTIQVENSGIASASLDPDWSSEAGMILVRGLLTGETTLTVIDNETNETCSLLIKVTDNYEVFRVSKYENIHPVLSKMPFLFLINNDAKDLLFADMEGEKSITDNGVRVRGKGSYSLTMEDNKPYITLIYATDDNGALTDDANITPAPHKFQITKSSEFALHRLDENLNLGWGTPSASYTAEQSFLTMEMEEVASGYLFETKLEQVEIPQDILK